MSCGQHRSARLAECGALDCMPASAGWLAAALWAYHPAGPLNPRPIAYPFFLSFPACLPASALSISLSWVSNLTGGTGGTCKGTAHSTLTALIPRGGNQCALNTRISGAKSNPNTSTDGMHPRGAAHAQGRGAAEARGAPKRGVKEGFRRVASSKGGDVCWPRAQLQHTGRHEYSGWDSGPHGHRRQLLA